MSSVHDRVPVMLPPAAWPAWFDVPDAGLLWPALEDVLQR